MIEDAVILEVLKALTRAGLCVCETSVIESHHPGLLDDENYIMRRIEEHVEDTVGEERPKFGPLSYDENEGREKS